MLVGYARVSTDEQTPNLQNDTFTLSGRTRIFTDTASGAKCDRAGLDNALHFVRPGDIPVVWRLDRRGRSLKRLIETIGAVEERGISFRSLQESIDTTTNGGKLVFHVFGALVELEQDLIRERTQAGLAAARARGRRAADHEQRRLMALKKWHWLSGIGRIKPNSVEDICRILRVSRSTLYRYIKGEPRGDREKKIKS